MSGRELIGKRVRIAHHIENNVHLHGMRAKVLGVSEAGYAVQVDHRVEFVRRVEELPPRRRDQPAVIAGVMLTFAGLLILGGWLLVRWLTP